MHKSEQQRTSSKRKSSGDVVSSSGTDAQLNKSINTTTTTAGGGNNNKLPHQRQDSTAAIPHNDVIKSQPTTTTQLAPLPINATSVICPRTGAILLNRQSSLDIMESSSSDNHSTGGLRRQWSLHGEHGSSGRRGSRIPVHDGKISLTATTGCCLLLHCLPLLLLLLIINLSLC